MASSASALRGSVCVCLCPPLVMRVNLGPWLPGASFKVHECPGCENKVLTNGFRFLRACDFGYLPLLLSGPCCIIDAPLWSMSLSLVNKQNQNTETDILIKRNV